jgi:predicted nucleotidyltransferase
MINSAIQDYLPKVFELFKKHKIKKAYIFGSALTDSFYKDSDVDLVTERSLKNPYFISEVNSNKVAIYG